MRRTDRPRGYRPAFDGPALGPGQVRYALLPQHVSSDAIDPAKLRPVVLVDERDDGQWVIVPLTGRPQRLRLIDGVDHAENRPPVARWALAGLDRPSWMRRPRIVPLHVFDFQRWCGWITSTDARTIAALADGWCTPAALADLVDGAVARDLRRLAHRAPNLQETAS